MAVTILQRPEGHILDSTENIATVNESYGAGDAQFVSPTVHGLVDGDYIYAVSDIENYAGFFYVDALTTGIFKLRPYPTGDYVQFIANGSITWFKSNLTHGWSCVHLPITYRLSTDLYPVNGSDTSRTINSTQNANGYTVILLSGSLGSAVNSYDFVKLTVPNDTELSGVYQILEFISPTVMIINLEYDASNNFTSATALKHYNNYNIIVRVYAGINSSHQWATQKPYELAATLPFIPDDNNEAFFSINEILKSYIETRNNLTLGTLPNNIDFWTGFYIETAESYDDSDGYVFGTFTSNFTSDQSNFEGTAVNAKLEFKNLHSGYLSEYLMTNSTAKFLTLFTIPVLFQCGDDTPNCYQDISFLNPYDDTEIIVRKQFYLNGNLGTTINTSLGTIDSGVIRAELEADCAYDRVDITVQSVPELSESSSDYTQTGSGADWTGFQTGNITGPGAVSKTLYTEIVLNVGDIITFDYDLFTTHVAYVNGNKFFNIQQLDENLTPIGSIVQVALGLGSNVGTSGSLTIVSGMKYIGFWFSRSNLGTETGSFTGLVNSLEINNATNISISETKEFDLSCGCANQELRLTWLNNLGGFDYWAFTAKNDHIVEIIEAVTTKKNILPTWPKSYGAQADTIRKQTARISNKAYTVRSQFLTESQADAIAFIKSSVLAQIIVSRTDRRTVLVDTDSFIKRKDGDKTFEIAFNVSFTDDIPVQTV